MTQLDIAHRDMPLSARVGGSVERNGQQDRRGVQCSSCIELRKVEVQSSQVDEPWYPAPRGKKCDCAVLVAVGGRVIRFRTEPVDAVSAQEGPWRGLVGNPRAEATEGRVIREDADGRAETR